MLHTRSASRKHFLLVAATLRPLEASAEEEQQWQQDEQLLRREPHPCGAEAGPMAS